jgi:hypothetical protein
MAKGSSALCQYDAGKPDPGGSAGRSQRRHPGRTGDTGAAASGAGLSLRHGHHREAACERALAINAISYSSVSAILKSGLDRTSLSTEPVRAAPRHANIRDKPYA